MILFYMKLCHRCGAGALVGGDFNASFGTCLECDGVEMIGQCGFGPRNFRDLDVDGLALPNGFGGTKPNG